MRDLVDRSIRAGGSSTFYGNETNPKGSGYPEPWNKESGLHLEMRRLACENKCVEREVLMLLK